MLGVVSHSKEGWLVSARRDSCKGSVSQGGSDNSSGGEDPNKAVKAKLLPIVGGASRVLTVGRQPGVAERAELITSPRVGEERTG